MKQDVEGSDKVLSLMFCRLCVLSTPRPISLTMTSVAPLSACINKIPGDLACLKLFERLLLGAILDNLRRFSSDILTTLASWLIDDGLKWIEVLFRF